MRRPGLLGWGWGLGAGEVARRLGLWQPSRDFGQSPAPPSPWLRSEPLPLATPHCLPARADPGPAVAGQMGQWAGDRGAIPRGELATLSVCSQPAGRRDGALPRCPQHPGPGGHLGCTWAHSGPHLWAPLKKPRDREAVGLSSPQGTTTSAHLVQPDVDSLEGGPQHWGRLQLSLEYDFGSQEAGHRHETKVHRDTLCPMFQETCCFHVPQEELSQTTLQVQVLSFKRFSAHEPLGELSLPLGTVDLHHVLEHWYQLGPPGTVEPEAWGELCFLLQYMPSSGRLTVVVLEARGLSPGLAGSKPRTSGWGSKQKRNRAITARRQHLKSVMLQIAAQELEKEESRRESEKQNYLSEHCPPLHLPGSMSEVQELCKQLHAKIDAAEEEKYDMEVRVQKSTKELEDMNQKLFDLRGKFKRPPLRRVRMSADAMLKALLGSKHKVCMDLRANLKQVKKEDTEKERDLRDVGDWRKNIEEKSGMEGRKKMFETES
uniref:Troponin I, cardiac muscle n=1 Tax=Canis lupus familiaris TaxID=9615 RepID=A0A8C0NQ74_CANLF